MALSLRVSRILKFTGLGIGCVLLAGGGFVLARYLASGAEFKGSLTDLAPADVTLVAQIDNIPTRKEELTNFLDSGPLSRDSFNKLEQSSVWRQNIAPALGGSLRAFRENTLENALARAEQQAKSAGIKLYKDVLEGEALLCADFPNGKAEFVALSRVSRTVRLYWQFLDVGAGFIPSKRDGPKVSVSGGVVKISSTSEEGEATSDLYLTVLADVLVAGNSPRLINSCIEQHGKNTPGLSANARFAGTLKLVDDETRKRHVAGLWLDLDRLRTQIPTVKQQDRDISPVDAYHTLPVSVIRLQPDLFLPLNRVLEGNLATEPFTAAYYGIDVSNPTQVAFDQYLLADKDRMKDYEFLRKTWSGAAAKPTQLDFLPSDTMMVVSYRQPLDVLRDEVLDTRARESFVGDFIRAFKDQKAEEVVIAMAPRSWAPDLMSPLPPQFPLPAFVVGFRIPGVKADNAGAMAQSFIDNVRGRQTKPGEAAKAGNFSVKPEPMGLATAYGFEYTGTGTTEYAKLAKAVVVGVVGDWLLMTNSRELMKHALAGKAALAKDSAFSQLPSSLHGTVYVNFEKLAQYVADKQLIDELRKSKYNPSTIEGRDPGEVRREIAQKRGLDPTKTESLIDPGVTSEFDKRKRDWVQVCEKDGPILANSIRADLAGLTFFKDLSLAAVFAEDHLHAKGILRLK
ncbi:MAG: hypothetical protein IT462_15495 [Planctomycetes bacterium]|nr:hypothetical protein [Planctomycetota bacterium]